MSFSNVSPLQPEKAFSWEAGCFHNSLKHPLSLEKRDAFCQPEGLTTWLFENARSRHEAESKVVIASRDRFLLARLA